VTVTIDTNGVKGEHLYLPYTNRKAWLYKKLWSTDRPEPQANCWCIYK